MKAQKARRRKKVVLTPRDLSYLIEIADLQLKLAHNVWLVANGIDLPSRHRPRRKRAA